MEELIEDKDALREIFVKDMKDRVRMLNDKLVVNERILRFIYDIWMHQGIENAEVIRKLFHDGYCYYFAVMLKDAFPGGYIAWARPFSHIVFVYNDVPYDNEGVYFGDGETVPYKELGDTLEGFRHRGRDMELNDEIQEFAEARGMTQPELMLKIYDMIPESLRTPRSSSIETSFGDAMKFFREYKELI